MYRKSFTVQDVLALMCFLVDVAVNPPDVYIKYTSLASPLLLNSQVAHEAETVVKSAIQIEWN